MRAVYLTAGAAGMYCGSCMHDNALARAMRQIGIDCLLQPIYTPIRTDEVSVAEAQVFFGGIHIYLLQQLPFLRWIPAPIRRTLDWQPLIQFATRKTHSTDAAKLGALTVSMLRGAHGHQADEVRRLADWIGEDVKPDAVLLTNLLIGGALPVLRQRLPETRLVVLLQGDDIFLDFLPEPYHSQAIELCRELVASVDQFVTHSRFYADKMGALLRIPPEKITVSPLSIDTTPLAAAWNVGKSNDATFRLGYLARIAPEKGLHNLVDAFVQLAPTDRQLTLQVAGWLGDHNRGYLDEQERKIDAAGLRDRYQYHGSPTLDEKIRFLKSLDLFSVPTDYHEPKGLFVLEALAAGVAVVQPDHGAFGELLALTGGGLTYAPGSLDALCDAIQQLRSDSQRRIDLAAVGRQRVLQNHDIRSAAAEMKNVLFPTLPTG
jgi:glycosyltransferase involved in cell wall biosynthesis